MAQYQITWKRSTYEVVVRPLDGAIGSGFIKIGEYHHSDTLDPLGPDVNHVLWHHVRDALYLQGILDMQRVQITIDNTLSTVPSGVTVSPSARSIKVGETVQLVPTVVPATAVDKSVTYNSYDSTIATVSNTGLVTALKVGVCGIQVTTTVNGYTAVSTITITAA